VFVELRPTPALLFFACPKKRRQKKGQPQSGPAEAGALRCSGRAGKKELALFGPLAQTALKQLFFLTRPPLRCSALPERRGERGQKTEYQKPETEYKSPLRGDSLMISSSLVGC
jgi:hypothetical protein